MMFGPWKLRLYLTSISLSLTVLFLMGQNCARINFQDMNSFVLNPVKPLQLKATNSVLISSTNLQTEQDFENVVTSIADHNGTFKTVTSLGEIEVQFASTEKAKDFQETQGTLEITLKTVPIITASDTAYLDSNLNTEERKAVLESTQPPPAVTSPSPVTIKTQTANATASKRDSVLQSLRLVAQSLKTTNPALKLDPSSIPAPGTEVDLSQSGLFPPIGDQGAVGSCAAWSIGYYQNSYMRALKESQRLKTKINIANKPEWICSPSGLYPFMNGGIDEGSSYHHAFFSLFDRGCPPASVIGLHDYKKADGTYNELFFPSLAVQETGFKSSINFPIDVDHGTWGVEAVADPIDGISDEELTNIKQALKNGEVLTTGLVVAENFHHYPRNIRNYRCQQDGRIHSSFFPLAQTQNGETVAIYHQPDCYFETNNTDDPTKKNGGHGITVVGFDDHLTFTDSDGIPRQGALKIANSWGTQWGHQGFAYISYDVVKKRAIPEGSGIFLTPFLKMTMNSDEAIDQGLKSPILKVSLKADPSADDDYLYFVVDRVYEDDKFPISDSYFFMPYNSQAQRTDFEILSRLSGLYLTNGINSFEISNDPESYPGTVIKNVDIYKNPSGFNVSIKNRDLDQAPPKEEVPPPPSASLPLASIQPGSLPGEGLWSTTLDFNLAMAVENGDSYKYALVGGSQCPALANYSAPIPKLQLKPISTRPFPDGAVTLCVLGYDALSQKTQTTPLRRTWHKDSQYPTLTINTNNIQIDRYTVRNLQISATDPTSGIKGFVVSTSHTLGASPWQNPAPSEYTFTTAGSHQLYIFTSDGAGYITSRSVTINIPIIETPAPLPAAAFQTGSLPAADRWATAREFNLSIAVENGDSYKYAVASGYTCPVVSSPSNSLTHESTTTLVSVTPLADGPITLCALGYDVATGRTQSNPTQRTWYKDSEAPVLVTNTDSIVIEGFTVRNLQISATDQTSGVRGFMMSTTPSFVNPQWQDPAPSEYTFTRFGDNYLYVSVTDNAGNTATRAVTINIPDTSPPRLVSSTPSHDSTVAPLTDGLTVQFNKSIQKSAGVATTLGVSGLTISTRREDLTTGTVRLGSLYGDSVTITDARAKITTGERANARYTITVPAGFFVDSRGQPNESFSLTFRTSN